MSRQETMRCCRCSSTLSDEQVNALAGITGMDIDQLSQYKLRVYCERCERFRERRSGRIGYAILLGLLITLIVLAFL